MSELAFSSFYRIPIGWLDLEEREMSISCNVALLHLSTFFYLFIFQRKNIKIEPLSFIYSLPTIWKNDQSSFFFLCVWDLKELIFLHNHQSSYYWLNSGSREWIFESIEGGSRWINNFERANEKKKCIVICLNI